MGYVTVVNAVVGTTCPTLSSVRVLQAMPSAAALRITAITRSWDRPDEFMSPYLRECFLSGAQRPRRIYPKRTYAGGRGDPFSKLFYQATVHVYTALS